MKFWFLFLLFGCLDYGEKIKAKYGLDSCILYEGQKFRITEVKNKHYKYSRLTDRKELVYPISIVDQKYSQIPCPE